MPTHNISRADQLRVGASVHPQATSTGVPLDPVTYVDIGVPVALVADALIKAATTTELPNAATVTYTFPSAGASPQDGSIGTTGTLDVPRNITAAATHASSVVAMTLLITGKDFYGQTMSEQLSIAATGTSQTATGKKAFKTVTSIAITSAGNAQANTLNMGFGDTLGLPFNLKEKEQALFFIDGIPQTTLGTVTVADTNAPTTTTGDVRGTWLPNSATDAARSYCVWMIRVRNSVAKNSASCAYGLTPG